MALVVLGGAELLTTLVTFMRLHPRVEELVLLQLRGQQEPFPTDRADVRPLPRVLSQVIHVQVSEVEAPPTRLAGEVLVVGVTLLVGAQGAGGAEGFGTGVTGEGFVPAPRPSALGA